MIDARRLALAGGILWGIGMFVFTILSIYTGYAAVFLNMIATVYLGYTISWAGSIIGMLYGFVDAFGGLYVLAWLYNKLK
jgi:hypothetical protein